MDNIRNDWFLMNGHCLSAPLVKTATISPGVNEHTAPALSPRKPMRWADRCLRLTDEQPSQDVQLVSGPSASQTSSQA